MRSETSQQSLRSRERDEAEETPPQEPSPAPSPRRTGAGFSGQDDEERRDTACEARISDSRWFRRQHPPPPAPSYGGPQDRRRHRRGSPPPTRRRGGSTVFHSRHQRFHERPGSDCSPRRQRLDGQHDPDLYSSMRQRFGHGSQGGRADGRSREVYTAYRGSVFEGGYIHGNDPNLPPEDGDHVYHAPYCGNLNFAPRTHRNNCNKHHYGPSHTSWRASFRGSPSRTLDPTGCVPRHDFHSYGSLPPHGWGAEDPRVPPAACGAKFAGPKPREREDYHDELKYRKRHQLDRPAALEWDRNQDNRRHPMSSRGRWISRERSRSPLVDRPLRGSFLGHGREDELNMVQRRDYRQAESRKKRQMLH
ncbi:Zn-finger in Ran binding protein [Musa troglodytarum]|uniref:Zn-finger in Ran binding protein n=1 Tax=Musa troglodytarum TaxID=320322 RepID=A0A9E7GKW6_9LILI|nr:Zn-finger in Ran binding protein [Musa troglodytarum]